MTARIWRDTPKIVFSRTLAEVGWNCRLVRDDVAAELERLKSEFDGELDVGGATLAAELIARDLIDEYRPVVHPVILGSGTPFLPALAAPIRLRLAETRRFGSGVVYLGYVRA